MFKLTNNFLKCLQKNRPLSIIYNKFSSSPSPELKSTTSIKTDRPQNKIVADAFASLHEEDDIKTPSTDSKISKAETVEELLSLVQGNGISRRHALNVVSMLAQWTSTGQAKLNDFENDPRFLRLCRVLTKNSNRPRMNITSKSDDLSTILSVTADDEAAKLVSTITLPQMVRVMTTLSLRKRRSMSLLRALSYNIAASTDTLNLKQSADLLYNIASLNFPDENLLAKVCNDITIHINDPFKTSAVFGSILTSIGLLKYKNTEILDILSKHILDNYTLWRSQDIFSYFITLASINYIPNNAKKIFKTLIPQLNEKDAKKPGLWLDYIWALVALEQATPNHIESVLNENFIKSLDKNKSLSNSNKLKLINIDGAAEYLIENYNGTRLTPNSDVFNVLLERSKEKQILVNILIESLKSLIQAESNLKTNVNTGLGFYIDAKCILDFKCNPLPVDMSNEAKADVLKVAIMVYDYHDMCINKIEPIGLNAFAGKLLEAQGFKVLPIPYTEFKPSDKLIQRVQYLENKLKNFVNSNKI